MLELAHGLSADQLTAVRALEERCVAHDGGRLKLEWGTLDRRDANEVSDVLWWEGAVLAGFCGRYAFGGGTPEATGMVDPVHRGRGIGSRLLGELVAVCAGRGDTTVLLVTPRSCAAARRLAERHGGRFHHAEHALVLTELRGEGTTDPSISVRRVAAADTEAVRALLESGFGRASGPIDLEDPAAATLLVEREGRGIATLRVAYEERSRGIYGFVVDPELRGQGIGRDVLRRVCAEALADGVETVHLEVEVDNDRALGLYTSVGFERSTTEDYFELSVPPSGVT